MSILADGSLSAVEASILELLVKRGELAGGKVAEGAGNGSSPKPLYVTLHRMEREGLVESHEPNESSGSGTPHRCFAVTERGRVAYQTWREVRREAGEEPEPETEPTEMGETFGSFLTRAVLSLRKFFRGGDAESPRPTPPDPLTPPAPRDPHEKAADAEKPAYKPHSWMGEE